MKLKMLFISLFFSFLVKAQTKIELGAFISPQLSNLYASTQNSHEKPLFTYSAGLTGQYLLSKSFRIKLELNYLQTGSKVKFEPLSSGGMVDPSINYLQKIVSRSNYLQIPFLIKYSTNYESRVNFFINTGPYWAVLLFNSSTMTSSSGSSTTTKNSDKNSSYLGWVYGLGFHFNISPKLYIPLELRYTHIIVAPESTDYANNIKYGTLGLVVGLTYKIGCNYGSGSN